MNYNYELRVTSRTVLNRLPMNTLHIREWYHFLKFANQIIEGDGIYCNFAINASEKKLYCLEIHLSDSFVDLSSQKPNSVLSISNYVINKLGGLLEQFKQEQAV